MKIKDIIIAVASYMNKKDIIDYLQDGAENPAPQTLTQIDNLVRLSNLVINELAAGLIPMQKTESIHTNKFKISSLTFSAIEILNVLNKQKEPIPFKIEGEYILSNTLDGFVVYTYAPKPYDINENINFKPTDITLATLSYGVSAEYCITEWRFEEAVMWRERYVRGLKSLYKPKNGNIKGRSWS